MYEVEVKIPADGDRVRRRLEALGATRLDGLEQVDIYFDHPTRSFADSDEALRLRREDGRAVLTYKGPKVESASKTRREIETTVEDIEAAETILRAVGFDPAGTVRKSRDRFDLDGYTVTVDAVDGLDTFVEVERAGEEADIATLRQGAFAVCERLGLDPAEQVRESYLELLADASG